MEDRRIAFQAANDAYKAVHRQGGEAFFAIEELGQAGTIASRAGGSTFGYAGKKRMHDGTQRRMSRLPTMDLTPPFCLEIAQHMQQERMSRVAQEEAEWQEQLAVSQWSA